ncbi:MAG: hypothetical protein K6E47_16210 [Lachnospiraceae bacterium]|nr:hypothetical protein [Lachnospiraceae bacterium]
MNIQIIYEEDDTKIAELYSSTYINLHAPQEVYRRVINTDQNTQKTVRKGWRVPKVASVAIIILCVAALGGGAVWAMTTSPLKDFFFKNSDREFTEVYHKDGKEYYFGNYKLVYEGSIYNSSTGKGKLHFTIWDKDGNPVDLKAENEHDLNNCNPLGGIVGSEALYLVLFRSIWPEQIADIHGDKCWILTTYVQGWGIDFDDNNVYYDFTFHKKNGEDYFSEKDFKFVLLNEDDAEKLRNEIKQLDLQKIKDAIEDSGDILSLTSNEESICPEIVDILKKFEVCTTGNADIEPQVINMENLRLTVETTSLMIEYNDECQIDNFTFVREDGTRATFRKLQNQIVRPNGDVEIKTEWHIENEESRTMFSQGGGFSSVKSEYQNTLYIDFNFILGTNEKIKIEINGKTYE